MRVVSAFLCSVVAVGLLFGLDRGCALMQSKGFVQPRVTALLPMRPRDDQWRLYLNKIDSNLISKIPDPYVELRDLKGQRIDYSELGANIDTQVSQCPMTVRSRETLIPSRQVLFDITYRLDEQCRRKGNLLRPQARQFILFFGDSITFGQGVRDDETFASLIGQRWPEVETYNYGIVSRGPNGTLEVLDREPSRLAGIGQPSGLAVYYFINSHMDRVNCPTSCMNENSYVYSQPYYVLRSSGQVELKGTFEGDRGLINFLYWPLAHSAIRLYWNLDFPRYTDRHYNLFVAIMSAMRQRVQSHLNLSDFVFVFGVDTSERNYRELSPRLIQAGFKILNYGGFSMAPVLKGTEIIPYDMHFSPRGHSAMADWLISDLKPMVTHLVQ